MICSSHTGSLLESHSPTLCTQPVVSPPGPHSSLTRGRFFLWGPVAGLGGTSHIAGPAFEPVPARVHSQQRGPQSTHMFQGTDQRVTWVPSPAGSTEPGTAHTLPARFPNKCTSKGIDA